MEASGSATVPAFSSGRGFALEARDLSVLATERVLLREVSLTLAPGELVALIGPSGAGKTTLLRALAGSGPLDAGSVALAEPQDDDAALQRRYGIGYVPSEDPLHDELTVTEELVFAAALRAPADVAVEQLHATVEQVIAELRLEGRSDARVGVLSKGERRRVSLGVELVGRPGVLLLDEPGSGLDAVLERRTMLLLRDVADRGQAVLAATHATASLALCDRVAAMSSGGRLAYIGTMDELFSHFGATSIEQIYEHLDDVGVREAAAAAGVDYDAAEIEPPREVPVQRADVHGPPARFSRQLTVLTERAGLCRIRDLRALAVLFGQAPIIGLAIGLVIPHAAVSNQSLGPYFSLLIDFALMTACVWLGTIAACRDIVTELGSIRQERAIGLRLDAYLIAKCVTLMPVVLIQTALMAVVVAIIQSTPDAPGMILACMVTGVASAALALWLSALSRNSDIAIGCTPLVIIPQLLLSGALIPTTTLPAFFRVISDVTIGRWSFDAIGSALHLNQTVGSSLSSVTGLGSTTFAGNPAGPDLLMLVLGAVALVLCGYFLAGRLRRTD